MSLCETRVLTFHESKYTHTHIESKHSKTGWYMKKMQTTHVMLPVFKHLWNKAATIVTLLSLCKSIKYHDLYKIVLRNARTLFISGRKYCFHLAEGGKYGILAWDKGTFACHSHSVQSQSSHFDKKQKMPSARCPVSVQIYNFWIMRLFILLPSWRKMWNTPIITRARKSCKWECSHVVCACSHSHMYPLPQLNTQIYARPYPVSHKPSK